MLLLILIIFLFLDDDELLVKLFLRVEFLLKFLGNNFYFILVVNGIVSGYDR